MLKPYQSSSLPPSTLSNAPLRVATYNIHKGVRGMGLNKRLEIHNLGLGVEALDADLVFLQEVRNYHRGDSRRFARDAYAWPQQPQAEFLAPHGYEAAYRTNAYTRDGEHGNALLSRWPIGAVAHHDVSDHRFEQRGLLHVTVRWRDVDLHAIVVHFGLIHASRVRQAERLAAYVAASVPANAMLVIAGDFNDWNDGLDGHLTECGVRRAHNPQGPTLPTFPSRIPVFTLDRVYTRRLRCTSTFVPRGTVWARMSDHLPLVVELEPE